MATGAAGAAEQQRQARAEEEEMTPYAQQDLTEDWEFKILRSVSSGFRRPERLAAILEEEGRAGWMLVEKFDNNRIRLKRRAACRKDDRTLDVDPYRTYVGTSETTVVLVVVGITVGVIGFFAILALIAG
jgi:hypothetical protein